MLKFTVGSDISKDKINFAVRFGNNFILEKEIKNNNTDLKKFIKEVVGLVKSISKEKGLEFSIDFVMEHTGIYGNLLVSCLADLKMSTYILSGLEIKRSSGISRGKDDVIDARRIADYAIRFSDKISPFTLSDKDVIKLKHLNTKRIQLVKTRTRLVQSHKDNMKFIEKKIAEELLSYDLIILENLNEAIKKIEESMLEIVRANKEMFANYKIAISVPGVGKVTAMAFICYTDNFTKFENAKSLGSYCGVVPFANSSGKYKGKDKVSHIANKKLKTLLHLGAMSAVNGKNAFAEYYTRKVEIEKKNKMLVINNVRNKIVKTMFACIKNKTKYSADYLYSFVA